MLLTIMAEHEQSKRVNKEPTDSWDNSKKIPYLKNMNITYDLDGVQPRTILVWNCDEIRFYPNGRWNKVVCNYKFFQGE